MDHPSIVICMATQADIDALAANASVGEATAIKVNGSLFAVTDEYGTATVATEDWVLIGKGAHVARLNVKEIVECLVEECNKLQTGLDLLMKSKEHKERGWVVVVHDVDSDFVWDTYNHEPTAEDIHFVVIDFFDRCESALPKKSKEPYFTAADMPDHCSITVARLGQAIPSRERI